jgi:lysophospholipase L1-like esterase
MNKILFLLIGWLAAVTGSFALEPQRASCEFTEIQQANRYCPVFTAWVAEDVANPPGKDAVLCVGSSSMRGWTGIHEDLAPLEIIHRGFGGSTMDQVLVWENFFTRYKAGKVVIYEGDNDLVHPGSSPEKFLKSCQTFCNALFKANPQVEIYIISIKPSVARMAAWPRMIRGNELLQQYAADTPQITFIEASSPMLDAQGQARADILLKDNLHMNKDGYKIWTAAVRKALGLEN